MPVAMDTRTLAANASPPPPPPPAPVAARQVIAQATDPATGHVDTR